jgi:Xaa-Pro dipeptidase
MDFERRYHALQAKMAAAGLGAVVCGPSPDTQYLLGVPLDWRTRSKESCDATTLVVSTEGDAVLVVDEAHAEAMRDIWIDDIRPMPQAEIAAAVAEILQGLGGRPGGIGLGRGVDDAIKAVAAAACPEPADAEKMLDSIRAIKDPEEIEILRRAAAMTDEVVGTLIPLMKEGVTQLELQDEFVAQGRKRGASGISFDPGVLFTKSGVKPPPEKPFTYPREQGLVANTSIALDVGLVVDGYCSDFGRSFYFGEASDDIRAAYAALQTAVLETVGKMHAGSMRFCDVFPALEQTLDRLGYGDKLRARLPCGTLGHNIGTNVHEDPWLRPDADEPLKANMVIAIEPKLWQAGEYYLRVEDMILVGETETEFLTNFDRELFGLG